MRYEILITPPASAKENMASDEALLASLTTDPRCILRFYQWRQPCATYGYFIQPERFFKTEKLEIARRPTGGGIIFHTCDLAFSVLIPAGHPRLSLNPIDNYAWINQAVLEAIPKPFLELLPDDKGGRVDCFCMAKPTRYDIMWKGRKVGGAAQRRARQGLLHQGSIALGAPDEPFLRELLGEEIAKEIALQSSGLTLVREQLCLLLVRSLRKIFGQT